MIVLRKSLGNLAALDEMDRTREETCEELDKALKALRQAFDQEARKHVEEDTHITATFGRIDNTLASIAKESALMKGSIQDRLKKLSDDLVAEAKERAASDETIQEIAEVARNRAEKETQDRHRGLEEHGRRVQDLHAHVEGERATRALHASGIEQQLSNAVQNHTAVQSDHAKELSGLRNRLQKLDEKVGKLGIDIRQENDETKTSSAERHVGQERMLRDLNAAIGAHVASTAKKQSDQHDALQSLKDAIAQENVIRGKERGLLVSDVNQVRERLEKDNNLRNSQLADLFERVKALSEALDTESRERAGAVQQGHNAHEQAIAAVKLQLEAYKKDLASEKDERIHDSTTLSKKASVVENHLTQQLRDLKSGLDAEQGARSTADERMERRFGEFRASVETQQAASETITHEFNRQLEGFRDTLGREAQIRAEEASKAGADLANTHELIAEEANERRKNDAEINQKLQAHADQQNIDRKKHSNTKDELTNAMKDMMGKLDAEHISREQSFVDVKAVLQGLKTELSGEKDDRNSDVTELRREAYTESCKSKQLIDELKQGLQLESSKRTAALESIERHCTDNKTSITETARTWDENFERLTAGQRTLKGQLEQQIRLHVDDEVKTSSTLGGLREALSVEVQERKAAFADLVENAKSMRGMVEAETKDRVAANDEAANLISQVKDHVDRESKERKKVDEEIEMRNQALVAKLAAEKADTEREFNTLKSQQANLMQALTTEKDERFANDATNKRALQAAEAQIAQQLMDARQALESEVSERNTSIEHIEKQGAENRVALEASIASKEAMIQDLEKTMRLTKQALAQETQERVMSFEENTNVIADMRAQYAELRNLHRVEVRERSDEFSDLRTALQKYQETVVLQFRDVKLALDHEQKERTGQDEALHKTVKEVRQAVLVAVRGSK